MSSEEDVEAKAVDDGWIGKPRQRLPIARNRHHPKSERKDDGGSKISEVETANIELGGGEIEGASPPVPVQVKSSEPLPSWWVFSRLVSPAKKTKPAQAEAVDACLTAQYEASVETDRGKSLSKSKVSTYDSIVAGRGPVHEYQSEEVISGDGALRSELNEDSRKPAASNYSAPVESRKRPAKEYPGEKRHAKRQQLAKKSPNAARQESASIPCNGKPLRKSSVAAKAPVVVARNGTLTNGNKPLYKPSPAAVAATTTAPVVPRNGTRTTGLRSIPKVSNQVRCSSTIEEVGSDVIPLKQVANYPQYITNRTSAAGTRKCVMCSNEAKCVPSKKKAGKNASRLILPPSSRVCNVCWVTVWELADGTLDVYCCHMCGHWRPWAAFHGPNKMMKSCVVCRTARDKTAPTLRPSAATVASPPPSTDNREKVPERDAAITNDTEQHRKQLDDKTNEVSVDTGASNSADEASKRVVPAAVHVASPSIRRGNPEKAPQRDTAIATNDTGEDTNQHNESMNGLSQRTVHAANPQIRCVKVAPTPTFFSSTVSSSAIAPRFRDLVNYPSLLWQGASESSTKICLMCGLECPLVECRENNEKIGVIWQYEKSVCSLCQVGVWEMVDSDMNIKWCTTCFDFRPWGCFHVRDGEEMKELSTCVVCRDSSKKRSKSEVQAASATTENACKSPATPSGRDKRKVPSRPILQWDSR